VKTVFILFSGTTLFIHSHKGHPTFKLSTEESLMVLKFPGPGTNSAKH